MSGMKKAGIALWALVAVALVALLWVQVVAPRLAPGPTEVLGRGDYALPMTDGGTFSQASLRGAASAVFFGFTHCPEVCPTTLGDIATWQERLAEKGEAPLKVFFVTVDPERDTAEVLGDYTSWVPGVTGVTGTPAEVAAAIKAFRVYARKVPLEDGGYTMDHTALVMLFDDRGQFSEPIAYQEDFDSALAKIERARAK
ncbi:SCO family protein [Puniceibacterium sp. HSS470]|jgi:protein SCO1/2|nr:SCO family protein [Puniceibacterium sp. HSS470]|tara:strand:+ start:63164 stop:63760 length:597 start_codon:yes stop_codon:yes gene_type:complete